jgi:phytoene dehydrogenase-like protein
MQEYTTDAIIIGAGLGGLLSAAQLLQRGKRVIVLERLPHSGGRFTAKTFQGVQLSTGAVHMLPFGSSGVLAKMLRRLQVPHRILDADVFGSFHVSGKQYRSRGLLGVFKFLGPRQFFWFTRIGYLMFLRPIPPQERNLPFDTWLAKHINVQRNRELVAFFECISRFALSLELHAVTTAEVVQTTKNMFSYGAPGIVQGGCGALTAALEQRLIDKGAEVRLRHEVLQICTEAGHVTGVRVRDKASGEETLFHAQLIVSDIGPRATSALLNNQHITQAQVLKKQQQTVALDDAELQEAVGLKVHILSDVHCYLIEALCIAWIHNASPVSCSQPTVIRAWLRQENTC